MPACPLCRSFNVALRVRDLSGIAQGSCSHCGTTWAQQGTLQRDIVAPSEQEALVPLLEAIEGLVERFGAEVTGREAVTERTSAFILRIPIPEVEPSEP